MDVTYIGEVFNGIQKDVNKYYNARKLQNQMKNSKNSDIVTDVTAGIIKFGAIEELLKAGANVYIRPANIEELEFISKHYQNIITINEGDLKAIYNELSNKDNNGKSDNGYGSYTSGLNIDELVQNNNKILGEAVILPKFKKVTSNPNSGMSSNIQIKRDLDNTDNVLMRPFFMALSTWVNKNCYSTLATNFRKTFNKYYGHKMISFCINDFIDYNDMGAKDSTPISYLIAMDELLKIKERYIYSREDIYIREDVLSHKSDIDKINKWVVRWLSLESIVDVTKNRKLDYLFSVLE